MVWVVYRGGVESGCTTVCLTIFFFYKYSKQMTTYATLNNKLKEKIATFKRQFSGFSYSHLPASTSSDNCKGVDNFVIQSCPKYEFPLVNQCVTTHGVEGEVDCTNNAPMVSCPPTVDTIPIVNECTSTTTTTTTVPTSSPVHSQSCAN